MHPPYAAIYRRAGQLLPNPPETSPGRNWLILGRFSADSRQILGRFSAEWIPGVAARLRFVITRPAATCMKDNDDG